jgi:hypothetical protein
VHEVTNWLAGGQGVELNVRASWSPTVSLPGGGGLSGTYQELDGKRQSFNRIDPVIDFAWGNGAPEKKFKNENFSVEWKGSLMVPVTGDYIFEVQVDDQFELILDGKSIFTVDGTTGQSQPVALEAGKPLSFVAKYEEEWGDAKVSLRWKLPDGTMEVIPASAFLTIGADGEEVVLAEGEARDPKGRERTVSALQGRRGRLLEVGGSALPGEYLVNVPSAVQGDLSGLDSVPLVVLREGGESRFEGWSEDDRLLINREIDLIELGSIRDVLAALRGEGFGREIWKVLALAALILLFLEGLLARWVSKSRKAGEEVKVDFEKRNEVPEEFLKAVQKTKGGAS